MVSYKALNTFIKLNTMYTLTEIREELKIKERSVNDLIRYIKTRTDDNPNYSLLLGAGCSVRYKLKLHKTSSPRINYRIAI